jgi:hypothetical protein
MSCHPSRGAGHLPSQPCPPRHNPGPKRARQTSRFTAVPEPCHSLGVNAWMRQHPWQVSALVWASGVALVLVIQILLAHASHSPVNWTESVAVAVIIPLVGSAGLTWGRQRRERPGPDLKP